MSTVNSFDLNQHFGELNSPLFTGNPTPVPPTTRKAAARANLDIAGGVATQMQAGVAGLRLADNGPIFATGAATAINTSATATAANLLAGIITSTTAAGVTITMPTGTLFEAAVVAVYPQVANGDVFAFLVVNLGGTNAITLAAGTNFTLAGGAPTVAANSSRLVYARRTSQNNWVLY